MNRKATRAAPRRASKFRMGSSSMIRGDRAAAGIGTTAPQTPYHAGNAAVFTDELASGIRQALADRARLSAAGLERVRAFSWRETARITADVYRTVLAT